MPSARLWRVSLCGKYACTTAAQSQYQIRDVNSGSVIVEGQLIGQVITDFAFYSRGWSPKRKRPRHCVEHEKDPHIVIVSKHGHLLSINLATVTEVFRIAPDVEHSADLDVAEISVCTASDSLYVVASDRGIRKHSLTDGKFLQTIGCSSISGIRCLDVDTKGELIGYACETNINVLDLTESNNTRVYKCAGSLVPPKSLRFSPCGAFLLAGFESSQLMLWRAERDNRQYSKKRFPIATLTNHKKIIGSDFVSGFPHVVTGLGKDGSISCWFLRDLGSATVAPVDSRPLPPAVTILDYLRSSVKGGPTLRCRSFIAMKVPNKSTINLIVAAVTDTGTTVFHSESIKVRQDGQLQRRRDSSTVENIRLGKESTKVCRLEGDTNREFSAKAKPHVLVDSGSATGDSIEEPVVAQQQICAHRLHRNQRSRSSAALKLGASQSYASVAEQGLQSKDPHIVEELFKIGDAEVVKTTVREISPSAAGQLLKESINKLLDNPTRLKDVREWIRQILINHAGYLLITRHSCNEVLERLYQHMMDRVSYEDLLSKMVGRIEGVLHQSTLVAKQMRIRSKFSAESHKPLIHHVEGGDSKRLSEKIVTGGGAAIKGEDDQFADDDLHDEDDT